MQAGRITWTRQLRGAYIDGTMDMYKESVLFETENEITSRTRPQKLTASPAQEWIRDAEAVEEVQIMEELPHQLRREISYSINRKVFKQLNLFHDFPVREQAQIAASMTPIQASTHAKPRQCCRHPLCTCFLQGPLP